MSEESTLSRSRSRAAASRLDRLNTAPADAAEAALLACCGSRRWARLIAAHRPY
ncbi:OHCU decarboxylase, partial [Streptomyces albiflaviniger]|nr:OHCU decarboxylase [Streptomyces albiflaviniger]